MEQNLHHVFFDRRSFNANNTTKRLRNDERAHIILPVGIHNELHASCSPLTASPELARIAIDRLYKQPKKYKNLDRMKDLAETFSGVAGGLESAERLTEQLPFLILGTEALRRSTI